MELTVKNVNKSFGDNHVLKDISFEARSGQAFGLLGRNGSGKTTSIRIIMDIFKADSGEVLFDGKKINTNKMTIGYLPEERGLYPKRKIIEQMIYFGNLKGLSTSVAKQNAKNLLEKIGSSEYLDKKLETLSKGNQQKIQLAIALINDPDIVILDEPFSGLDPVNAKLLKDLVKEEVLKKKLVLFSSHQMANVEEFCDDICIINKGKIVLNGNLQTIKNTYSKDNILINPSVDDFEKFNKFINENVDLKSFVNEITKLKNGWKFNLKEQGYKNNLLRLATENFELDTFTVIEPSLEDIFIEKAGDINE